MPSEIQYSHHKKKKTEVTYSNGRAYHFLDGKIIIPQIKRLLKIDGKWYLTSRTLVLELKISIEANLRLLNNLNPGLPFVENTALVIECGRMISTTRTFRNQRDGY